jgi:hypothetical protein
MYIHMYLHMDCAKRLLNCVVHRAREEMRLKKGYCMHGADPPFCNKQKTNFPSPIEPPFFEMGFMHVEGMIGSHLAPWPLMNE